MLTRGWGRMQNGSQGAQATLRDGGSTVCVDGVGGYAGVDKWTNKATCSRSKQRM